jgi:hypothetical protein
LSLFNPSEANPGRVKPADRKVLEAGPGVRMELLSWGNAAMMEPHLFRIAPSAGSGESYAHDGEEFLYIILRGTLEIVLGWWRKHRGWKKEIAFISKAATGITGRIPAKKKRWCFGSIRLQRSSARCDNRESGDFLEPTVCESVLDEEHDQSLMFTFRGVLIVSAAGLCEENADTQPVWYGKATRTHYS